MLVTKIEQIDKRRVKIVFEDGSTFPLYMGEFRRLDISEGMDMPEDMYRMVEEEILCARCKERAFYILKNSDKTEKQLKDKLAGGGYPPAVIQKTLDVIKKYGYIDDYNYARSFVNTYSSVMSVKMMEIKLAQKGISRDIIKCVIEEMEKESGYDSGKIITEILHRKKFNYDTADIKEKNRMINHLLRKGFKCDEIMDNIKNFDKNFI